MNHRIGTIATLALAGPTTALAHTGRHAHVHPGDGPWGQVTHWLAGIGSWTTLSALVLAGLAAAVVVLTARIARRGR